MPLGRDSMAAVVIVCTLGAFMSVLDQTVVNIAIQDLTREFDASLNTVQWVLTGYLLTTAMVIPASGYLADRFGIRRIYLISLIGFTIASILCGAAWDLHSLIAFRVLQGIGGGALMPLSMAMIFRIAPANERGKYTGLVGIPVLLAPAFGPVVGGLLVEYATWRWIFFINIPFGVFAAAVTWLALREQEGAPTGAFDWPGITTSALGFAALLFGLSEGPSRGWDDALVIGSFALAVVALALFVRFELQRENPMVDLRLFREREFRLANLVIVLASLGLFGGLFLLPIFFQRVQGLTAAEAGLLLMPQAIASGICMPIAGRLYDRLGPRWIITAGMSVVAVTSAGLIFLEADTSGWAIAPLLFVRGIGLGFAMMPSLTAALNSVHGPALARATALTNTIRQVAGSFGVAILATFLQERGSALRDSAVQGLTPGTPAFFEAIQRATVDSFHEAFLVTAIAIVPAIIAALGMRTGRTAHASSAEAQAAKLEGTAM
jgi:DHA2 family multidrug resistance protein